MSLYMLFFALVTVTVVFCVPIMLIFWLMSRKQSIRHLSREDEERLRKLHQGLTRMEERMENLETIVGSTREGQRRDDAATTRTDF